MFFEITIIDVAQLVGVLSRSSCGNIWKIKSWRDQRTRSGASLSNQQHAADGIRSILTRCGSWAGRLRSISHCPRWPTQSGPASSRSRGGPSEAGRLLSNVTWIDTGVRAKAWQEGSISRSKCKTRQKSRISSAIKCSCRSRTHRLVKYLFLLQAATGMHVMQAGLCRHIRYRN